MSIGTFAWSYALTLPVHIQRCTMIDNVLHHNRLLSARKRAITLGESIVTVGRSASHVLFGFRRYVLVVYRYCRDGQT